MKFKKYQLGFVLFFGVFFSYNPVAMAISGAAKVTIKVVDENNQPIEGANVGIGFNYDKSWATGSTPKDGFSDSYGLFSASAKTNGYLGFTVTKNNYYESTGSFNFEKLGAFRWEPWNPELTVVLRKIENPVPMYARDTRESRIEIPVIEKKVGFDLIVFDWVAPYGAGISPDFIFTLNKDYKSRRDYDFKLKLEFGNEFDGIQQAFNEKKIGSVFILPRTAPLDGYKNDFVSIMSWHPDERPEITWSPNNHYIFRVRSEVEDGKLKRAMYGKILGGISIGKKKEGTAYIEFKYYLNPDYTRNLEYDSENNLFGLLPPLEQVGIQ